MNRFKFWFNISAALQAIKPHLFPHFLTLFAAFNLLLLTMGHNLPIESTELKPSVSVHKAAAKNETTSRNNDFFFENVVEPTSNTFYSYILIETIYRL